MKPRSWRTRVAPEAVRAKFLEVQRRALDSALSCVTKKRCYASRSRAKQVLVDVCRRATWDTTRTERFIYRCRHCHQWHLTSKPRISAAQLKERSHVQH